jgi:hypothetical protein
VLANTPFVLRLIYFSPLITDCLIQLFFTNVLPIEFFSRGLTTNLVNFSHSVFNAFHGRTRIDAIYIDFTEAFDKINNHTLQNEVSFWVSSQLLTVIASHLKQRKQ